MNIATVKCFFKHVFLNITSAARHPDAKGEFTGENEEGVGRAYKI